MFRKPPDWYAWLTIAILLSASLLFSPDMIGYTIAAATGYLTHCIVRDHSLLTFSVQVRAAYLLLLLIGLIPPLAFVHWIQCVGVWTMLATDYCFLARCLSLAPWNRRAPLTAGLVWRTFFSAPRPGIILDSPALRAPPRRRPA